MQHLVVASNGGGGGRGRRKEREDTRGEEHQDGKQTIRDDGLASDGVVRIGRRGGAELSVADRSLTVALRMVVPAFPVPAV